MTTQNDMNIGAMHKDHQRDCRFGFCRHPQCHRKAARRFQNAELPVTEAVDVDNNDIDPGFDVGATHKDWLREQRIERILNSGGSKRSRRNRRARRGSSQKPFTVYLTEDGSIDKRRTRDERLFGRAPLYV